MTPRFPGIDPNREVITISDDDDDRQPRSNHAQRFASNMVNARNDRYFGTPFSRPSFGIPTPDRNATFPHRRPNQRSDPVRQQDAPMHTTHHAQSQMSISSRPRETAPTWPSNFTQHPPPSPQRRGDPTHNYPPMMEDSTFNKPRNRFPDVLLTRSNEQPVSRKIQKRACSFCIDLGEAASCDGGNPCSACVEPNPEGCEYPGEHKFKSQTSLNNKGKYFSTNGHLKPDPKRMKQRDDEPEPLIFQDFDLASCDSDSIKSLLKRFEQQMQMHREYLLQSELMQAKLDCQKFSGPERRKDLPNPFAKLISKAKQQASDGNVEASSPSTQIMVKNHRGSGPKRFLPIKLPVTYFKTDESAPVLPKYKSIGRLGSSFLTRNVHTLKYMPYSAEDETVSAAQDEKEQELKQRYKSDDEELIKQRKCQEMVYSWKPWIIEMMRTVDVSTLDILYCTLLEPYTRCKVCAMSPAHSGWQQVAMPAQSTHSIDPQKSDRVKWVSEALLEHTGIGLWHIIADADEVKTIINKAKAEMSIDKKSTMCSICFFHDCPSHGTFRDNSNDFARRKVKINDPEVENNAREFTNLKRKSKGGKHQCGFYCVPGKQLRDFVHTELYGLNSNGIVKGIKNPSLSPASPDRIGDLVFCSHHCFWSIEKRRRFHPAHQELKVADNLSEPEAALLRKYISLFANDHRAPCLISKQVNLPCIAVFYKMVSIIYSLPHQTEDRPEEPSEQSEIAIIGGKKISRLAEGYDTSRSRKLDARMPYVPCDHSGPCLDQSGCSCSHEDVHCEWFCGCDESCKRRFQGCKCKGKRCFNDDRCECWSNNRECDPWLCGSCGVLEVLDPNNKYRDDIREGRCQNNRIQLDLPARTIKAPSEVQGWGLFAGQDMDVNTFIGEYKGEVISTKEGDRRGVVYHNIGQEYLFITNSEQQIDGSNFGNKTRFMNNSQLEKNINVLAKNLLSNGVQRVMFYTKRPVKAGEELLYNYNYPDHVVKHFWERGEKPASKHGVPAPVAKPRIDGRFIKSIAGKQDGEESAARKQEQSILREKRKRISDGDEDGMIIDDRIGYRSGSGVLPINPLAIEASDDSDYEEAGEHFTEESASEEGSTSSAEERNHARQAGRKRRIHEGDRRRGGLAQKRAWETRKRNGNY